MYTKRNLRLTCKKNSMSDWEFIFDGIFGFLTSPLWNVPVLSFIEAQSVVFDESDENHLSWTEVHNKYKTLIESLLGDYLKDVGITEEQFLHACTSPQAQSVPEIQMVLHHLLAGEDFEVFKKMMIEKNMELQIQALNLIKQNQGKTLKKLPSNNISSEEEMLKAVMQQSLLEYEKSHKSNEENKMELNLTKEKILSKMEDFGAREDILVSNYDNKRNDVSNENDDEIADDSKFSLKELSHNVPEKSPQVTSHSPISQSSDDSSKLTSLSKLPSNQKVYLTPKLPIMTPQTPLKFPEPEPKKGETSESAASQWIASAKQEAQLIVEVPSDVIPDKSNEDMKKRELYLKQQRDRLLAVRNDQRKKQLTLYTTNSQFEHPITSKTAYNAVNGEINKQLADEEKKQIAIRRALAEKLKKEVLKK